MINEAARLITKTRAVFYRRGALRQKRARNRIIVSTGLFGVESQRPKTRTVDGSCTRSPLYGCGVREARPEPFSLSRGALCASVEQAPLRRLGTK